jgi:DNA-binding NarL/FixJ family response regulator
MEAMARPALGPSTTAPSQLVVSADRASARERMAAALVAAGLAPTLSSTTGSEEIDGLSTDAAAVFVLACAIDEAAEMTALRRLRREIRAPALVVVSPTAAATGVRRALDAGADAIVFEPEIESALAITVLAVACGQLAVPRARRASVERPALSHRERQSLVLVTQGLTNGEIAKRLFLSESTIKSHLSSAFAKLGVRSRKEAAALFRDRQQLASLGLADLAVRASASQ